MVFPRAHRWISCFIFFIFATPAVSQFSSSTYFGKNKVQYKKFDWHFIDTEHFVIHFYPEEEQAAMDAAYMAEDAYAFLSRALDWELSSRVPLFLYASVNDFQQTNIIHGLVGQGTRGVTEGVRNRMALPLTGSYRELYHVLTHEMVHAFQFDIIKSRSKSFLFGGGVNIPLWFVEGMAEYLSNSMDTITRMWVRDAFINNSMPSVQQLNSAYDIRVYRIGQSFWHYIGENHGTEMVGKLFKATLKAGSLEKASEELLSMDLDQLTREWHQYAGETTFAISDALTEGDIPQEPEQIAELLTKPDAMFSQMNIIPAISPEGEHLVYLTNKNFNSEIVMMSGRTEKNPKTKKLVEGNKSESFEALHFFDTSISWTKDGQIVTFVAKAGKNDVIYIMNPHTKKIMHKFKLDELNGIKSPSFSPDGNAVIFVGMDGGISDLYMLEIDDESLIKLTNDRFAALHPQWSPDGSKIAFVTDYDDSTNFRDYVSGNYDLALFDLEENIVEIVTNFDANVINPQWSPDNREIAFVSDHEGVSNIYKIRLDDQTITPVTRLQNGVAGITEATPAFSWSANGDMMVFSAFQNAQWHLYLLDLRRTTMEGASLR